MSRTDVASKNEFGKFWVLGCVAHYAKHLDVCWISSETGRSTVRFDVVPLQVFLFTALFAFAAFFYHLSNSFAATVSAFACAAVPFMVRFSAHSFASCYRHARNGAVFPCTTVSLANLKVFFAFFARTLQHGFGFSWPKFLRAVSGASICLSSHMGVRASKLNTASSTGKCYMPTPFNFSLES